MVEAEVGDASRGLAMTGNTVHPDRHVMLPDGTEIGYAELGVPGGHPMVYLHGSPSCRLQALFLLRRSRICSRPPSRIRSGTEAAERLEIRLVAPDRPGVGLSPFRRYTVRDYPQLVGDFADAVGLDEFAVVGVSGGAKYACACAWGLGGRVTRLVLESPTASFDMPGAKEAFDKSDRLVYALADRAPWLLRLLFAKAARDVRRGDLDSLLAAFTLGPRDLALLVDGQFREQFSRLLAETFRQGARGATHDYSLEARPWGVPFDDIRVPTHIWHGEGDRLVPSVQSRIPAEAMPAAVTHFVPVEEHLSLGVNRTEEILASALVD